MYYLLNFKSAFTVATLDYRKELDLFVRSKESLDVQRYRDIAENTEKEFNVEANDWFNAATARIDKLKSTEQALLDETVLYAQENVSSKLRIIVLESIELILMLAIAYAVCSIQYYQTEIVSIFRNQQVYEECGFRKRSH